MSDKTRIVIAGIGGVGGYFGGLLAGKYFDHPEVEICFFSRGKNLQQIRSSGLKILHGNSERTVLPQKITDDASRIGPADLVILCTKSYDLAETVLQLLPCITSQTVLLPLLNGVDATSIITSVLPGGNSISGCVYIVARLKAPGVVENSGNIQKMFFGRDGTVSDLEKFQEIFTNAGIESKLSNRISALTWEKFIFISSFAVSTSYYNMNSGTLRADTEKMKKVEALIHEASSLSEKKNIDLPSDIREQTLKKIYALNPEVTSSMHSDFLSGKGKTELSSLAGYIVTESKKHNLAAPVFEWIYQELMKR